MLDLVNSANPQNKLSVLQYLERNFETSNWLDYIHYTVDTMQELSGTLSWGFWKKKNLNLPGPNIKRQKWFTFVLLFLEDICKIVCPLCQQLCWQSVSIVKDYADTISAYSLTTWTPAKKVVDFADTMSTKSTTLLTQGKLFYFWKRKI